MAISAVTRSSLDLLGHVACGHLLRPDHGAGGAAKLSWTTDTGRSLKSPEPSSIHGIIIINLLANDVVMVRMLLLPGLNFKAISAHTPATTAADNNLIFFLST
jgi:hypothetical protein